MNRFTKEVRKRGFKTEADYEYLPCGDIESAWVNAEKAECYVYHYGLGIITYKHNRDMTYETIYEN